jgi:hypothetical protein
VKIVCYQRDIDTRSDTKICKQYQQYYTFRNSLLQSNIVRQHLDVATNKYALVTFLKRTYLVELVC